MKRNKFLTAILGAAILSGVLCSGIIIATGIQKGKEVSANASSARREKYPKAHQLEKTELAEFSEISLQLDYSNVKIIPSDGYYLEYWLDGTCKEPAYEVSDGKFRFQEGDIQQKYQVSFHLFGYQQKQEPFYLNLYVPEEKAFDLLAVDLESGNFEFEGLNVKKADLSLDYGNLKFDTFTGEDIAIAAESGNLTMGDVDCGSLQVRADYGNVTGSTFTVSGQADLKMESGNLELSKLAAGSLKLSDEYGNCTVDEFRVKDSWIAMESGNLKLREAALENLEADSEYGSIDLALAEDVSSHNFDVQAEYGTLIIEGKNIEADEDGIISYVKYDKEKKSNIQIRCESGNITIK